MDTSDSIFVHSPKTHYHSKTTAAEFMEGSGSSPTKSDSSSKSFLDENNQNSRTNFSGSGDSDVSEMIVNDTSRFQNLSSHRKKSGESEYRPASDSNNDDLNSKSGMESESDESLSEGSIQKTLRLKISGSKRPRAAISDDDSDESRSTSRSISNPAMSRDVKNPPVARKSPLGVIRKSPLGTVRQSPLGGMRKSPLGAMTKPSMVANQSRTNIRDVAVMRGYRYSMHPSRSAAMNVCYKRYLIVDEKEHSDDSSEASVGRRRGRRKDSDSEFEVPGMEDSSEEEASIEEDSEDEYCPPKRKGRVGRRRKVSFVVVFSKLGTIYDSDSRNLVDQIVANRK